MITCIWKRCLNSLFWWSILPWLTSTLPNLRDIRCRVCVGYRLGETRRQELFFSPSIWIKFNACVSSVRCLEPLNHDRKPCCTSNLKKRATIGTPQNDQRLWGIDSSPHGSIISATYPSQVLRRNGQFLNETVPYFSERPAFLSCMWNNSSHWSRDRLDGSKRY